MKFNCDRLSDWIEQKLREHRNAKAMRERLKRDADAIWHDHFVFYKKLEHGDCRVFETIQRRGWCPRMGTRYYWQYRAKRISHK
jgi:hypothetical protein